MTYPKPLLMFASPQGLDLPHFNTLRLGGGWLKRVKAGDRVLLATKLEVIGSAKVVYIEKGKLPFVLGVYAAMNHTELGMRRDDPDYDELLAPSRTADRMLKLYGPQLVTQNSTITAIGLKR